MLLLVPTVTWVAKPPKDAERFWPAWRGPHMTGVAPYGNPPVKWSETNNVKWKVEIPGKGSSSPIVWRDMVFVTSAIQTGEKINRTEREEARPDGSRRRRRGPPNIAPTHIQTFVLYAIHREDGKIFWEQTVREELPHEGHHPTGTFASNSPVTDGERVYAYFGSRGLYCFDMDGNLLWEKDLGDMRKRLGFGEGASPALHGDRIIINWDHEGQSFIVALDKRTGKELWRTNRDEITSWSTPIVVEHNRKHQVITNATNKVRSYDFETGKLIWEASGMTLNTIPSPVASNGMVYVTSGFRGNALLAIRLADARGDITDSDAIVWRFNRDTPYAPSPLLYGNTLYFLKRNSGILSAFNARTGEAHYGPKRLTAVPNVYASPVGSGNRVYIAGRDGAVAVLEHGREFKLLGINTLADGFDASPAVVANEIYLRGRRYLYRISED